MSQTDIVGSVTVSQSDLITIPGSTGFRPTRVDVIFHFHVCLLMSFVNKSIERLSVTILLSSPTASYRYSRYYRTAFALK